MIQNRVTKYFKFMKLRRIKNFFFEDISFLFIKNKNDLL